MALPKTIGDLSLASVVSAGAYIPVFTGGLTRSVQLGTLLSSQGIVSVRDPDYGAVGDGVTDDTAAIQAAIDDLKDSSETTQLTESRYLYFPKGIYLISSPISLYSGIVLSGDGQGSLIKASGGFAGTALVLLKGQGINDYCQFSGYRHMGFECTGTIWCVKSSAVNVVDCNFIDGWIDCGYGLDLGTYTQGCTIDTLYGHGNLDQLIHLIGNWNKIRNIDKEGSTGSSTDPYIFLEDHTSGTRSNGNEFDGILIEQTTSVNKSLIKILNSDYTVLNHIWLEPTLTDGYGLRIDNCVNTRIVSMPGNFVTSTKVKIDTSQNTRFDYIDLDGDEFTFDDLLEIDAVSDVHIGLVRNRRGEDLFVLSKLGRNIFFDNAYERVVYTESATGYSPIVKMQWLAGQNLAINGSFEAGNYGWTFSTSPTTTEEYITSEVGQGLMGHFIYAAASTHNHYQSITVPANMPVTITAKVKCAVGANSFITLFSENLGITQGNGYPRASVGSGWQIITRTIIPTSAGSLLVGLQYVSATEVYVDEFSVSFGNVGVPNMGKFGTLEIGGVTFATGSEASPSTGTWKKGSVYFTTSVTSGSAMGAVCIVAGSPGTWKPMANLGS